MQIYNNIRELIGKTPLIYLNEISKKYHLNTNLIAKLESFNPAGSIKDRIAKAMIEDALSRNLINKDTTIIEPTSGNTGIGLALIAASLGLKLIIVMPDTNSIERRRLLQAYGARLVLTRGALGMKGSILKAQELHLSIPNSFIPSQFDNLENPKIHFDTTGPEIYKDTDGKVDAVVVGVGTGGSISGIGRFLKSKNKDIKVFAVEPYESPFLSKGKTGPHHIEGIGNTFVPNTLDRTIIDEIISVKTKEAFELANEVSKTQGILVGISSGAVIAASIKIAQKSEFKDKNIVAVLADSGERYLSTPAFLTSVEEQ